MLGSIYKITCIPTGLSYIGQTCDYKYKKGKPYNYGPIGRWSDHVSSSKRTQTPLSNAIKQYGKDNFTINVLEKDVLEKLDELEAKWIAKENTVTPNGLNVAKHSRNKHHLTTTIASHFKDIVELAELRPIKKSGEYKLIHLILQLRDGSSQRICFGQNNQDTYEIALRDAKLFGENLGCRIVEKMCGEENRYVDKIHQFEGKTITKIRITTATNLVAVYITTSEMKTYKDVKRICFGGKNISQEEAYNTALKFVKMLKLSHDCIIENVLTKSATGDHPKSCSENF